MLVGEDGVIAPTPAPPPAAPRSFSIPFAEGVTLVIREDANVVFGPVRTSAGMGLLLVRRDSPPPAEGVGFLPLALLAAKPLADGAGKLLGPKGWAARRKQPAAAPPAAQDGQAAAAQPGAAQPGAAQPGAAQPPAADMRAGLRDMAFGALKDRLADRLRVSEAPPGWDYVQVRIGDAIAGVDMVVRGDELVAAVPEVSVGIVPRNARTTTIGRATPGYRWVLAPQATANHARAREADRQRVVPLAYAMRRAPVGDVEVGAVDFRAVDTDGKLYDLVNGRPGRRTDPRDV